MTSHITCLFKQHKRSNPPTAQTILEDIIVCINYLRTLGYQNPGMLPLAHNDAAFLEDLSTQMAISQATRRLSRGATATRPSSTMRVSKPSSASNSPRSSMLNRRRTMVDDAYVAPSHYQQQYHQYQQQQQQHPSHADYFSTMQPRSSRPVSWHPSSQMAPQYPVSYPLSTPSMYTDRHDVYSSQPQFSPMLASYSNNTSPGSAFSPLPLAYHGVDSNGWATVPKAISYGMAQQERPSPLEQESFPSMTTSTHDNAVAASTGDWNTFIMHGFSSTSPPTPDSFLPPHQLQPAASTVPQDYETIEEPEEQGEILVGMGLYDTPEKYQDDPHLNNYRSTVSSLLGSKFRPHEPEGKGLKLEETWEPPKSDDEDESEEADDDESDD